ncbi:calcium-binding protein [Gordonia sp. NPDC003585]|uniref:FMN-binding protein n=1 Tax=Gordonia sp. NPDC003585 TaxID=3154275 RepID=UPI0033B54E91
MTATAPRSPSTVPTAGARGQTLRRTGGALAAMAAVGMVAACGSDDADSSSSTAAESTTATSAAGSTSASGSGEYKDGTYTATGEYTRPGGQQEVGVTVTLANSIITGVTIDTSFAKGPSAEYQGKFSSGISAVVVGKNIDDIDVHKVSGSSLTSGGFNQAIENIKTQAQA